jgi:hypothetical protein
LEIKHIVEYRKTHPVANPDRTLPDDKDTPAMKEWKTANYKRNTEMLATIQRVLRERGVPEEMLTPKPLSPEQPK